MGTNYYWYERDKCECCGREYEGKHIGKSSGGWCFALHVYLNEGVRTLEDWIDLFNYPDSHIANEYGEEINQKTMVSIITERNWKGIHDEFDYRANQAEHGPNGLVRSTVGGNCIGHGEGTWDYIEGEFS